jgi:DNA-binding MarR family transcriptional regulator
MPAAGDLDPVIHTQARLRIMTTLTALPTGDRLTFPRLQQLLDTTAGNLSTHLRRLEDAGYVAVTKGHIGRVPATHVEATRAGRRAFEDYVAQLAALLTPPTGASDGTAAATGSTVAPGPASSPAAAPVPAAPAASPPSTEEKSA